MTADHGRTSGKADEQGPSFEQALARLEEIVVELERSDLSLEETLARYEEGSRLVRACTKRLEEAEQRIRQLGGAEAAGAGGSASKGATEEASDADDGLPF